MGHPAGKKEEGRARVLEAAGRGFRRNGYGAIGVDGLAKEAGVTSGAFYAHFRSKSEAFRAAVVAGMESLRVGIEDFRSQDPAGWRTRVIDFYLTVRRQCDMGESCALQNMTVEVGRADEETRRSFEAELRRVIDAVADGLPGDNSTQRRTEAIALLALLTGGVSMARAVQDPALSDQIAKAVREAAIALTGKLDTVRS